MEFQTPAISEKFQSRFGWKPSRADHADTGLGTTVSDSAEGEGLYPLQLLVFTFIFIDGSAKRPKVCKSPSNTIATTYQHHLITGRHSLSNDVMYAAGLMGVYSPDVRMQLHMTGLRDDAECRSDGYCGSLEQTYKVLPEARPGVPCSSDPCGKRGIPSGPGAPGDPSGWQQHKQKLESLRLQVEQMQLMTGGSGQYSALYPPPLQTESKWEAVVKANENLLKEKELIIERQKQQLCQLEQRLRESELQIHSALMGRGAPFTDVCLLRLQEAQRENAFLRSQFAECSDSLAQEKLEAERRLAAVEVETQRLSETLKESREKHSEELKKQEDRIRNRDKHINNLKKKCQKESEQNREKQQRIETLERYLADMPTMEDYQNQRKRLEAAEQKVDELHATELALEAQLEEARSANRSKDSQLEEQRRRERELLNTVTSLQARVQEGLEDGARLPSLDVEKLREENAALREEQQKLKKVIEKQLRMMEQLGSQIRSVQQQLCEEESSSQALREELEVKEKELLQLHSAMKELLVQNQDLMEQGVGLREQLTQQLHREMAACLSDLSSLCSVLTHTAHGKDPNLSLLLGITVPVVLDQCDDWNSPAVLQKKLQEALQLRRDVEALRTTVSDRYAQDMGDNCTTQ
uniref:Centrosomal protein 85 n=1 Tax=Astyanax mexicanus TaxID=7994 RepID=A0A8B9HLL5_ASTMX